MLDRTNGKSLLTTPFAAVNWAKGIDEDGRPIPNPDKEPHRDGRLVAPDEAGGTNYRSPSFDPETGLFIVSAVDAYGIYFFKPEHGAYGWAGADSTVWARAALRAIDYQTGKIRWSHDIGRGAGSAGVLTTASGSHLHRRHQRQRAGAPDERRHDALALRDRPRGQLPDHLRARRPAVLVVGGGSALYAWTLPDAPGPALTQR